MIRVGTKIALLISSGFFFLPETPAQAWTTDCQENRCGASVAVKDEVSNRKLLSFAVLVNRDGSDPAVLLTTPLGTALEPGARIVAGSQDIPLTFKACYPDGCQAYGELTEDQRSALSNATTVEARFFAQGNDKPYSAEIELTGLNAALAGISDRP